MTYYQILKQRRIDLKLTIQDVSVQTRLAPEYIQAIEENNLDVFSDDYSFVRYFVHSYANAIGVNWNAIQNEVDQTIKYYAHKKNMALTMAQQQIVKNMPNEKASKRKSKKRSRSRFQSSVTRMSRMLHWPKQKISRIVLFLALGGLLVLLTANGISSYMSTHEENVQEAKRKAELQAKEQETQKLSEQRKETQFNETKTNIVIERSSSENGVYYITSESGMPWTVQLSVSVPKATKIEFYQGDTLVAGSETEEQSSDFSYVITCTQVSSYRLVLSNYSNNTISLNGQQVSYSPNSNGESDSKKEDTSKENSKEKATELIFEFGTSAPVEAEGEYDGSYYGYDQSYGNEDTTDYDGYDLSAYGYDYGYGE